MVTARYGDVIHELPLCDSASLRKEEGVLIAAKSGPNAQVRDRCIEKIEDAGKLRQCGARIQVPEDRRVIQSGKDEVIHHSRAENVGVVQLTLVLRLNALGIEDGIDRIGISRLRPAIKPNASENLVIFVYVVIYAAAHQPFLVSVWR